MLFVQHKVAADRWAGFAVLFAVFGLYIGNSRGQDSPPAPAADAALQVAFHQQVRPFLAKYCFACHNENDMESGVRVDHLGGNPDDRQLSLWKGILHQVAENAMPPEGEPQPSAEEREQVAAWIPRAMDETMSRNVQKNGLVRRLTVAQYANTLRDLLGLNERLTESLPPDAVSKDGFTNHDQTLILSPLQVEAYFDIAQKALDLCVVDERSQPAIQNFRMDFGAAINPQPCPDSLVLGALSMLLNNNDFVVTEPTFEKPFAFQQFRMRTKYDFIEGYAGNDTVRGWRTFDSIYHSVFACVRGTPGYPLGEPYQVVPEGLLLRPAIPSSEIFGQSNTYGPMSNFKISLRELPDHGDFRVTVHAARYDDGLLLDANLPPRPVDENAIVAADLQAESTADLKEAGIYQIDVGWTKGDSPGLLSLELGSRRFAGKLQENPTKETNEPKSAFLVVRLPAGKLKLVARCRDNSRLRHVAFHRLPDDADLARRFQKFEQRFPSLGVYVGLRRDCGSTLSPVAAPILVASDKAESFVFQGSIRNFPSPDVEPDNVNYLAGIREIGVRSEYTDGRDVPRLLVRSVEFEGPYYESWPPATHRNIFIESNSRDNPPVYARQILESFATRAFRRSATESEVDAYFRIWSDAYAERQDFQQSVKEALLVVLTSPQFLFLIEESRTPDPEELDDFELASKLSYLLWNTMPDARLLSLAANHQLRGELDAEIDRLVNDPRFDQFIGEFAAQWLSLDKFDVVSVDAKRYPRLTRDVKTQLRQEPIQYLRHLIRENLPVRNLVESDFIVANEVVADYYGLGERADRGFEFVAIRPENPRFGGVLSQAAILAGLTDGRESNPVKRGAWLARKIIAEPPDDPPPNVPNLPEDDGTKLTLRQKLERHRNQNGCAKCHAGIDPWGLPLENYDAGGLFKQNEAVDARSTLPDGEDIADALALKTSLAGKRLDQVRFSFLKHAAIYAAGRSLTYNELVSLREEAVKSNARRDGLKDLLRYIIHSDIFLKK